MAMAATPQSQHRCVFVGNIPYDATEEQLIQICEEVGPVVSFRLVIDRETGKPKGYGFCEYKDEETALSARRNLQGYQINGRQLRVDFAENDKNADKNTPREQGRGGPGVVPSIDPQKQFGGATVIQDPGSHQPVGGSVAMAAATVMAGALGAAQTSGTSSQAGFQSLLGTDVLTRHLAKMSRAQLTEIMSELKAMASENKEQAQQLLLAFPNLPKALFQAQIMLGMVSQQMLQKPNIQQATAQLVQSGQTPPGLPPLPQNKMPFGVLPHAHETQASTGLSNQYGAVTKFPTQPLIQRPQLVQNQVLQQGQQLAQSGTSSLASMGAHSLAGSHGPHIQISTSSYLNQQLRPPLSHHGDQALPTNSAYNDQLVAQSANRQTSAHPLYMAEAFQPSSSTSSALPANVDLKRHDLNLQGKREMINDSIDHMNRAPKMVKLNDGVAPRYSQANLATPAFTTPSVTTDLLRKQTPIAEKTPKPVKQVTQMQLPAGMDSTLLQQVLNLTQEQLSCLPPDQQQQVIQLQQMLQQAT